MAGPGSWRRRTAGARDAGATSVGLNIVLPHEQTDESLRRLGVSFDYFFARKLMFVRYSRSFVVLPGGYGTLDELFEALTLIQTGEAVDHPVVLVGRRLLVGAGRLDRAELLAAGRISPADLEIVELADEVAEVVAIACADAGTEDAG